MASRGRKPDPNSERSVDIIPPGVVQTLDVPDELTDEARPIWQTIVPFLAERGALVASDVALLIELVEVIAETRRSRHAMAQLRAHPAAVLGTDPDGIEPWALLPTPVMEAMVLASPDYKRVRTAYLQSLERARMMASTFGATPTDRIRLGLTAGGEQGGSLVDAIAAGMRAALAGGSVPA